MRINRDTLLRIAQDTVSQRTRAEREIQAAYLCGSLLGGDPLLGGTTDIDLVFIHMGIISTEREITYLTEDVHLDIAHHLERDYRQARRLRKHPWLGPTIANCKILYDPHHLMDFTQASVRGQFNQPENILSRARPLVDQSRQEWLALASAARQGPATSPQIVEQFFQAVESAANAVALLSGPPLTERRFLLNFRERAESAGSPGLYAGLLGLLGAGQLDPALLADWLPAWQATLEAMPEEQVPARLHPARRMYYLKGLNALLKGDDPRAALWPLLRTWTLAAAALPGEGSSLQGWQAAAQTLGLEGPSFAERIAGLDAYLDTLEEVLERWSRENGVVI